MSASNRLFKQSRRLPKYQPLPWSVYIRQVLAKDGVLWIALSLGLATTLVWRPPLSFYADSIDVKTLACLASLMTASGGLMISGVFDFAAARLVNRYRDYRSLMAAVVFCTFFSSMFITNDVALIVFVPMTLLAFRRAGLDPILAVVLQTVAANVGSVLLPMGNPQNLFIFSRYQLTLAPFIGAVLPLALVGSILLALFCIFAKKTPMYFAAADEPVVGMKSVRPYIALFLVAILAVFDVLDYRFALAAAVAMMAWKGRNLIQQVDYALLLTFVGFFVFVGNISRVPRVETFLEGVVGPSPYLSAVLSSQIISNVPAAVLLSNFTEDYRALLAGVSAGGCGTLIASMASLISYKLYARSNGDRKKFILVFTAVNILFLAAMTLGYLLSSGR